MVGSVVLTSCLTESVTTQWTMYNDCNLLCSVGSSSLMPIFFKKGQRGTCMCTKTLSTSFLSFQLQTTMKSIVFVTLGGFNIADIDCTSC